MKKIIISIIGLVILVGIYFVLTFISDSLCEDTMCCSFALGIDYLKNLLFIALLLSAFFLISSILFLKKFIFLNNVDEKKQSFKFFLKSLLKSLIIFILVIFFIPIIEDLEKDKVCHWEVEEVDFDEINTYNK